MEYLSVAQIAKKWEISVQRVRFYCRQGRIPGVLQVGRGYLIPSDAEKPQDYRTRTGKQEKEGNEESKQPVFLEQEYREIFESIPTGILVIAVDKESSRIVYCNRAAERMLEFGRNLQESCDLRQQMEKVHPNERAGLFETIPCAAVKKGTRELRFRYWTEASKEYRWFQLMVKLLKQREAYCLLVGSLMDVNRECAVIEELKSKTQLLEKAESNSKIHYVSYDVDSQIMILEGQTQRAYRLEDNILRGYPDATCRPDILYPEDYEVFCRNLRMVAEKEVDDLYFNLRVMGEKGFYHWRRIHIKGICDEAGHVVNIRGTSIEIDHYIKLQESYAQALEQNEISSWEYDAKLKKSKSYGITVDFFLLDENSLIRMECVHPKDRRLVEELEQKLAFETLQQQVLLRVKRPEAKDYLTVKYVVTGMYEYDGQTIQKYLCTVRKI